MIWYDMIYDMIWYVIIRYDMIWYGMVWYDTIWHDIWYDMIRYDMKRQFSWGSRVSFFILFLCSNKVKCTNVQKLRLCTGPTAHRRSSFLTTALEVSEGSAARPGRSLLLGKTRYPLYRRLGGPQGRSGQVRKISPPPGFDPQTVQPVASRYTDWATRPTCS